MNSLQYFTDPQLLSFYGWWQLVVSMAAFLALIAIWWHIGKRQKDLGQVWLALSILCWSFSGLIDVYQSKQLLEERQTVYENIDQLLQSESTNSQSIKTIQQEYSQSLESNPKQNLVFDGWKSILSLFNSLFILFALPWFKYIPGQLEALIKSKYWYYIIGLPFLFSLLPTISKMISGNNLGIISELDAYYGILTLVFLGAVLWESFTKRRLVFLAWLTVVVILVTSVAQIYKLTASNFDLTLLSAIFKTCLIMLFFALALSWVKELAQNIIPEAHQIFLAFHQRKTETGKLQKLVSFKGFPGKENRDIPLTPAMYDLFLKFSTKKTQEDEWLEIKPKNDPRSAKTYDIKDHNEIRRLLNSLLDGLFGKDNWTKDQHYSPLKDCLFEMSEKRERKIRLRIPGQNISV